MTKQNLVHALFAVCFSGLLPLCMEACPVCMVLPARTISDEVIICETVLFAREDPDRPFCFKPVELLKGDAAVEEIDLFVDSSTRRQLKANPNHVVVLARTGADALWRSLGIADDDFKVVIRQIGGIAAFWMIERTTGFWSS